MSERAMNNFRKELVEAGLLAVMSFHTRQAWQGEFSKRRVRPEPVLSFFSSWKAHSRLFPSVSQLIRSDAMLASQMLESHHVDIRFTFPRMLQPNLPQAGANKLRYLHLSYSYFPLCISGKHSFCDHPQDGICCLHVGIMA